MKRSALLPVLLLCFLGFQEFSLAQEISTTEYRERRERLMKELDGGVFVIRNRPVPEEPDKPNSDFFYLTGIEGSEPILVLAPEGVRVRTSRENPGRDYYKGKQVREILFLPSADPLRQRWDGEYLAVGDEAKEKTGIEAIYPLDRFDAMLASFAADVKTIAFTTSEDRDFVDGMRKKFFWLDLRNVEPLIAQIRRIKSTKEIALLQGAVDLIGEQRDELLR